MPTNVRSRGAINPRTISVDRKTGTLSISAKIRRFSHDTRDAVQCLIHEVNTTATQPDGQDTLNPYAAPSGFPFDILAGSSTPLAGLAGKPISSSNSIVSLPIYDDAKTLNNSGQTSVTFVGFLQVFINAVDQYGNITSPS